MSEELKPCPWCGQLGVVFSVSDIHAPLQYSAIVRCESCSSRSPDGSGVCNSAREAAEKALTDWNDRADSAELTTLRARVASLVKAICNALPGVIYMDPPDGGSISLDDQLGRMAKDAVRYRWLRESAREVWDGGMAIDLLERGGRNIDEAIDQAMQAQKK